MCNSTSIIKNREYGGLVCKTYSNKCIATEAKQGSLVGFSPSNSSCPFGSTKVGDYHTHGFYLIQRGIQYHLNMRHMTLYIFHRKKFLGLQVMV